MLGNYGVMSAKNGGINVIITTTVLSFVWYMRGNKVSTVSWAKFGNIFMGFFFFAYQHHHVGCVRLLHPANVRVGLSVPQVATTLSCLFFMFALNSVMMKGPSKWVR